MSRVRFVTILVAIVALIGVLTYRIEVAFPGPPNLRNTETPLTQAAPSGLGSYDLLGRVVSADEAETLALTPEGQAQLAPEQGAVAVTQELIDLGREAFYTETFGNEVFFTDVAGAIAGPINLVNVSRAIAALKGGHTTNLQIRLDQDVTIGGKTFPKNTLLNTGLDVPARSLVPLGMQLVVSAGKVRMGVTCALCHATVNSETGRILEGAPNNDLDTGILLAFATNSAAMFRQAGVNPTQIPRGSHAYVKANGKLATLPDPTALENAVDADLLSWAPGNFDSTGNMVNNPSQNPSSYTHQAYPYGWSGFSSIGWFHGLTTLNNNVHATNSDPTTGADSSQPLLGIDKETYLGTILQNSANPQFRLPEGAQPSVFFDQIDPTPGEPGMNQVVRMPAYPLGSLFALDGLMASSPGSLVGNQLNGMSAWQNTLAPSPHTDAARATLERGAQVFTKAGCAECHSGRYFTNHAVIAQNEVGTQPSRARALSAFPQVFHPPQTYPSSVRVPLPSDPPVLAVPTDISPEQDQELAYAVNNPKGGYKVPSLIGLHLTAPYLHDGGVAASAEALKLDETGAWTVANADQMGLAGTLIEGISVDPAASLRVLVDRQLRDRAIITNRANPELQRSNADGSGHAYWVDPQAGFTPEDQTALVEFLLSLDDDPKVLP